MKTLAYLPIAILTSIPVTGFAHKVPYGATHCAIDDEQAEVEGIPACTQEEKEKSAATAFCKFVGRSDSGCAEGIINYGLAAAAGKCVDEALQKQIDLKDELVGHKTGGNGGGSDTGYWHTEYRYSKENGWHRHNWSEAAREKAGREYGTLAVRQEKEASAINKTTSESSTNWDVGGVFKGIFGVPTAGVEIEANGSKGGEKTTGVEKGPLSEQRAKEIYDKASKQAETNPNLTNVNPDIMCVKNEPNCGNSFGAKIPNEDYKAEGKKPASESSSAKESGSSSGASSSDSQGSSTHTPPKTSSNDSALDIQHTPAGTYAGDPGRVTKPGEMLANWDKDNLNSPISRCLIEQTKQQILKDKDKTYNPDGTNLTPEQRKKEAAGLLRKGVCSTRYYSQAFCQKQKVLKLSTTHTQHPIEENKTHLFDKLREDGKYDYANPNDFEDWTPIDLSERPKTYPDLDESAPIKFKP